MIPTEKSAVVLRGVHEAFGATAIDSVSRIASGLSSDLVFRIVVHGSPFVLQIMTRMDEFNDPRRRFACMKEAAEAGIAPRVHYANAEDGISITDFVEETAAFPVTEALVQLPRTLRRLHALPLFPKTFNYVTAHKGFIWRFRGANLVAPPEIEGAFAQYERVCAVYPRLDSDLVSCHMDPKPENIRFDGERVRLVGWQAAMVNDRYFDLAVAANFVVTGDVDEQTYLGQYFGQPPDEYQRARFFLMRQVVHMLSATVFLLLGAAGKPISRSESLPSFPEFHRKIWAGEVDLVTNDLKIVYGLIHWDQLLENVRGKRFEETLGIVSERNTRQEGVGLLLPSAP
jgi:aminoglycoside phosphotransferase